MCAGRRGDLRARLPARRPGGVKPPPSQRVLAAWDLPPERCAYRGDAVSDMRDAHECGVPALAAAWAAHVDPDLLGAAEKAVEGKIRGYHRSKQLGQATTPEEKVKFALKDLSIENLDRYRLKINEATTELNTIPLAGGVRV